MRRRTTRPLEPPRARCTPSETATSVSTERGSTKKTTTHPLALALIIIARNHVSIAPHLTPAVHAPIVRLGAIINAIGCVHRRAATRNSTRTSSTGTSSASRTSGDATAASPIDTGAGEDGRVGDYGARHGHAWPLELRVHRTGPATDAGDSRRVWRDVRRVTTYSGSRPRRTCRRRRCHACRRR